MKKRFLMSLLLLLFAAIGFSQTVQRIEAESFTAASGARAENNAALSGGKNVGYIKNNTWIKFAGFQLTEFDTRFDIAAAGATGGTIEIRLGSETGTLIGTATVSGSTGYSDYKIFSTTITPTTGTYDLVLVFKHPTSTGYLFNLDYFEKVTNNPNAVTYTLATSVSPVAAGTITANPAGTTINQGTEITLTANKNFGYNFTRWVDGNGTPVSTANPYIFTINANTTLVAEYQAVETYNLTVNTQGAFGLGDYTIAPAGKDGAFSVYEKGTNVTVTAVENDIVKFNNWADGSTAISTNVVMDADKSVTATYDNVSFIAGWTFKNDQYANPRIAELYSNVENKPQLSAYNVVGDVFAPNVRLQNRGGKNGFCVWNTVRGDFFYFQTSFSTVGYKNIVINSGLMGYYYGCDEWTFQYSLDGINFTNLSSLTTINTSSITAIGGTLPVEAEGKEKVYIRWFPNVNGTKHGSAVDVTATILSNVTVMADEIPVVDTVAPVLESTLPTAASTSAAANGTIILNFNEKVKSGAGEVIFNGKKITAEFVNKTVKFSYFGLEYNKPYTFNVPAGFIVDESGNAAAALSLSFTTMSKPVPVKRNFDLIVDANATDDQVASGKYVKTIAEAFSKAPSNTSSRYLVLITNGTYNLGGDGTNPQGIVLQLPSGKNNVSLIAQSKDKVILQGNPGWGIKNAVLSIEANDLYMENITIEHKDGITTSGQRPALNPAGDRNVYNGVRLRSKQDTQVTGGGRSYYYKSTIEGDVDFICGGGTHWFEECNLVSVANGYIVAPNHDANTKYGYIFNNNTITAASSYYLGRPWQNSPRAVYLNTKMINEPNTLGWASMGTLPALFAEYNSMNANGGKVNTDNRTNVFTVSGVPQTGNYNPVLTQEQAAEFTIENVLSGTDKWDPRLVVEQLSAPANLKVVDNNKLQWDADQYAISYLICKEGKVLAITTEATYDIMVSANEANEYSVQAVSEYGGLSPISTVTVGSLIKKSAVSYFNSIDNAALTTLTPVEYTEGTALTLPTPTLQGYTFYGWSSSATVANTLTAIPATATGAQTFYAFWGVNGNNQADAVTPVTSAVSYINSIDSQALTLTPATYTEGTALTLPVPTKQGYTFYGWSSSATVANTLTAIPATATGAQTFYAFWGVNGNNQADVVTPVTSAVSYINSIDSQALTLTPATYTEGTALTLPVPTKQGYTFYGWSSSATVANTLTAIPATATGAQTFYAFWGVNGNNQADVVTPPSNFDYEFTAAVNKSWDNAGNFNPAVFPEAGKQVSVTKEIETSATVFLGDITFSGAGTLRLRGAHKATGSLIFKEDTRIYYNTSGAGMSIEAPVVVSGNLKCEMLSGIADQANMTFNGPVSGSGKVTPVNVGQGTNLNTGTLLLKGDNSEFAGIWDLTQKSTKFPALNYVTAIEGASANAFGSGTINVDKDNYVVFSNERAAGDNLILNIAGTAKAVLNTVLRVKTFKFNGVELSDGTYDKTTHPTFFTGEGSIVVNKNTSGGDSAETIPAFPGAEGYGKYVSGGRGGKVIYVTNLNDSGTGSLRAAVNTSGPKIILFKVSGNIKLESELSIYENTTIAGQTAPGGGITIQDYNVKVRGNNVILRYLRFRMGDTHAVENDALGGRFQENIIIDHCSVSWSTDESASFYENKNFTMQWCVISESLRNSVHAKGAHGYGGIWGGLKASFHHNLLAHHDSRNPRLGEYAGRTIPLEGLLDIRNNVIYNWGGNSCYGGDAMNVNLVNNYWKPGPGTSNSTKERILSTGRNLDPTHPLYGIWGNFFVDGNYVVGSSRATEDNWTYGVYNQFHGSQLPVTDVDKAAMRINAPHNPGEITTHSATKAFELVLDYVGASLYRDEVDQRAVNDTRSGGATIMNGGNGSTNGYIDTPSAAGGWPVLPTADAPLDTDGDGMPDAWETTKGLNPSSSIDGNLRTLDEGYTNVEVYINSIVNHITTNQNGSLDVYVNPENFIEKYNGAEDGSRFIMATGTYTAANALAIKNHKYRFVADENAKPVLAVSFVTEDATVNAAAFDFKDVSIDLTNGNSNFIQLKNGASISGFEIANASIKGVKQSLLLTEGNSENAIDKIAINNCIIDGTAVIGNSFIQPDAHIVNAISIKNSTIYNFDKGNNFVLLQNKDANTQALNVVVESNTIYNLGSQSGNALVYVNNAYSAASTFSFKNNILQNVYEVPKTIYLFNSTHNNGVGTATLDNNLVEAAQSQLVKGTIAIVETNVKTVSGLGMTMLAFPNPTAGDFSFSKNSPLATASSTAAALGDPRWLKATATFTTITYINAVDGQTITTLSPLEYKEGSVTILPTPVLEGYTFFGWSTSATVPAVIKSISATATGAQTFYAFWGEGGNNKPIVTTPTTYTISYLNLPKLVINTNAKVVNIGTAYQLLEAQCRGYRFMGWYSEADYRNEISGFDATQSQNISVYGRWKKLEEFYAYPTVSTHKITLKSSVADDTVSIVSLTGVVVKEVKTTAAETDILISDLSAGTYFIKSSTTGMTTRIIVK